MIKIHIISVMGFWENVVAELDYKGLTNKSLAEKCGFDPSSIGRGIKLGSSPSVETAVKIAKALNVSVEYLTGESSEVSETKSPQNLTKKYYNTLKQLDSLPEKQRDAIIRMIKEISS
ncbi:MAG: helix-turn-helix transcriptional regulator [Treponema sp.]|jgi:transcriptional regulator with XRE-family HTH domain|nr:helix-turn-helix transcriptional regulator [Treponema sp.]